jgi:hypothetical protein
MEEAEEALLETLCPRETLKTYFSILLFYFFYTLFHGLLSSLSSPCQVLVMTMFPSYFLFLCAHTQVFFYSVCVKEQ